MVSARRHPIVQTTRHRLIDDRNKKRKNIMAPAYGFNRPCLTCGQLARESYCEQHKPKRKRGPESSRRRVKKSTLYGGDYKRRAKIVRATAQQCHLCGGGAKAGDPWEADHIHPELGSQSVLLPAHRSCNRKRGNRPMTTQPPRT